VTTTERAPSSAPGVEVLIKEARRRQRRRRRVIAAAVGTLLAVVVPAIVSTGGGAIRRPETPAQEPSKAGAVAQLNVRWRTKVTAGVVSMTLANGSLWVAGIGAVTRMDATSGLVIARIATPRTRELSDVASLDGMIWVSSGGFGDNAGVLYGIDPVTNRIARTVSVPGQPSAMTAGDGYLWIDVYQDGPELRPFDPRTGRFLPPVISTTEDLGPAAYGLGSVWVASAVPAGYVWRIDPKTMRTVVFLQTPGPAGILQTPAGPDEIVTQAGSLWISLFNAEIARVSPATGRLEQQIFVRKTEGMILVGTGHELWALLQTGSSSPDVYLPDPAQPGRVGRIDTRTGSFEGQDLTIGDSGGYESFVATQANAWVGDSDNSAVIAIGETRPR
jgi:hypothetical protein